MKSRDAGLSKRYAKHALERRIKAIDGGYAPLEQRSDAIKGLSWSQRKSLEQRRTWIWRFLGVVVVGALGLFFNLKYLKPEPVESAKTATPLKHKTAVMLNLEKATIQSVDDTVVL